MTITTTSRKAGPSPGNDATTVFSFAFKVFEAADLSVIRTDPLGVETELVLDATYSVSLNSDQDTNPGGNVTLTTALPTDYTLTIVSDVPYTQPTDIQNAGGFFPEVVVEALDRLTILVQQLGERIDRAVLIPVSAEPGEFTLPAPEANALLAWNSDADGIVNHDPADLINVVAAGNSTTDTFNGDGTTTSFTLTASPGALANLRVSIDGVVQVPTADYLWTSGTTLSFVAAPPNGTVVFVQYGSATEV